MMRMSKISKRIICLSLSLFLIPFTGCGNQTAETVTEKVELVDPVGVALNYEEAALRTLYDAKVYSALVCPYTEEYELEDGMTFQAFDALPGETVGTNAPLLHSDTSNVDKQIEDMEKSIQDMDEAYQEFVADNKEALVKPTENHKHYEEIIERLEEKEPEEFITVTDPATGAQTTLENPEYGPWAGDYKYYDGLLRSAGLSVDTLTEAYNQRTQLYELDREYNLLLLDRKKALKNNSTLQTKMDGVVAGIRFLTEGNWMNSDTPMMAVADVNTKLLRCEYLSKKTVSKAEDVYAIINGQRVEVAHQPIETDEYKRLEELNGKVYSSFTILGDDSNINLGDYGVIVVRKKTLKDVLTVPKDAVKKDDTTSYVYVVKGNESVYTPVKTGMTDGVYTEIVSGLSEGDRVLTDQAIKVGEKTVTLAKGEMHYDFNDSGFVYLPTATWVKNPVEYGTTYFVEEMVTEFQQVSKGDVLATVRVVPDQIELDRKEKQLLRERERLEDLKKLGEEENKKAIANRQKTIDKLEESIAKMKENFSITQIVAPVSGIISGTAGYKSEDLVVKDATMYLIAEETKSYVFVQDENSVLTYGNQVTITYEDEKGKKGTVPGTIVTLNAMSLSRSLTTNNQLYLGWGTYVNGALAMVSSEDVGKLAMNIANEGRWRRGYYQIDGVIRSMDQVVLVPRKAVKDYSGVPYVKVKQPDGGFKYQSFLAGGSDNSYYWVVDGLTEGMELCIE